MLLDDEFSVGENFGFLDEKQPRKRNAIRRWLEHVFRERQVYLRSDGQVQFITLRPWLQISFAIVFTAGLFWLAFATVNIVFKDQLIALKEHKSQYVRITYEDRLAAMRTAIDGLNGKLLLDQNQYLQKVDALKAELDAINKRQARIETFFRQGWMPTKFVKDSAQSTVPEPVPVEEIDETLQDGLTEPLQTLPSIRIPGQSSIVPEAGKRKRVVRNVPNVFRRKYKQEFKTHEQARQPLSELSSHFATLNKRQLDLLDEIDRLNDRRIQTASKAIRRVELNPKTVVRNAPKPKLFIGGPFINSEDPDFIKDAIGNKLLAIGRKMTAHEKLVNAMRSMPITYPLRGDFRVTSNFGIRRDPFRRTRAMHTGIDFKARYGHPIRATADGIVDKSGRYGAYGKMVEIRHRHGITTRYAHMSHLSVKPGQRVRRGDVVGKLGNTGRSTGAHLHYETRVYKKALSPRRFWEMRLIIAKK